MDLLLHTLDNGIRLVHQRIPGLVAHCGIIINIGSRDETEKEHGIAHFIEHMLFKGTRKRKAVPLHSWDCRQMLDTTFLTSTAGRNSTLPQALDWKDTGHGLIKI